MGSIVQSRLCPCGSGKTFQQCCSRQKVIPLHYFLQQEIEELEQRLLAYTMNELELSFSQSMEEAFLMMDVPEESDVLEIITLFIANWVAFCRPVKNGKTAVELFIDAHADLVKHRVLKEALPVWKKARPNIYRIVQKMSENRFVVQPLFGGALQNVNLYEKDDEIKEGYLLLGVLVPIGIEYTFFMTYLDNHPSDEKELMANLLQLMREYEADNVERFIETYFPVVLDAFLFESDPFQRLTKLSESQKEVAELFQREMEEAGMLEPFIDVGVVLWYSFCQKCNPNIVKPNMYAAALHYLVEKVVFGENENVQSEILKGYGVTQKRLFAACQEFEKVLQPELEELHSMIENL